MDLSVEELSRAAADISRLLVGGRVRQCRQPSRRKIILELRLESRGERGRSVLVVSVEPGLCRLGLARSRPAAAGAPPAFCMGLRKQIGGACLDSVVQLPGERVVLLEFDAGARGKRSLAVELTGRGGNLFLLGEKKEILDHLLPIGEERPGRGTVYEPQPRRPPGVPARPGRDFSNKGEDKRCYAERLEEWFSREEERLALEGRRRTLGARTRSELKKARRLRERIEAEMSDAEGLEGLREEGELLKSALGTVPEDAREVVLPDYFRPGAPPRRIAIPPGTTPSRAVAAIFSRYKKMKRRREAQAGRLAEVRRRESSLAELASGLEVSRGGEAEELSRLEERARKLGISVPKAGKSAPAAARSSKRKIEKPAPFKRFRSPKGALLLVGRDGRENDRLTFGCARGNDLWFHALGLPGSHVVARLERGETPDRETLLDGAHLALHYSRARSQGGGEVAWTRVKYVRKVKGADPGKVTYSQEKIVNLRLDEERLKRLFESAGSD